MEKDPAIDIPLLPLSLISSRGKFSLTPFKSADCLLSLDPSQFALRYKPSFSAYSAKNATLRNFLSKSLEQLILALIRPEDHRCHTNSPPFNFNNIIQKICLINPYVSSTVAGTATSSSSATISKFIRSFSRSKLSTRTRTCMPSGGKVYPNVDRTRPSIPSSIPT